MTDTPTPPASPPRRRGPGSRADSDHPTRWELIAAAIELAERNGLPSLSVAQITAAAGHAKGTFYVHFPDRAALMVAVHRWFHDTVFARVISETSDDEPGPQRAARRVIAFLDECRELAGVRALLIDARTEPALAAEAEQRNRQASQALAEDLRGAVAHPVETARMLVLAAADIAARESMRRRRLPAARRALVELTTAVR